VKSIGRLVVLVRDYDEAIRFYRDALGFEVFVDIDAFPRRFVHVRLPSQPDVGLWLMQPEGPAQRERVGTQTAGQPLAVLYTDDLAADFQRLTAREVRFVNPPREEAGACVAHFVDLYGNEFVLVQRLQPSGLPAGGGQSPCEALG
jgi:catechol 2,3-dioxygenase-like lactoylglutathione lyase family enzyme